MKIYLLKDTYFLAFCQQTKISKSFRGTRLRLEATLAYKNPCLPPHALETNFALFSPKNNHIVESPTRNRTDDAEVGNIEAIATTIVEAGHPNHVGT